MQQQSNVFVKVEEKSPANFLYHLFLDEFELQQCLDCIPAPEEYNMGWREILDQYPHQLHGILLKKGIRVISLSQPVFNFLKSVKEAESESPYLFSYLQDIVGFIITTIYQKNVPLKTIFRCTFPDYADLYVARKGQLIYKFENSFDSLKQRLDNVFSVDERFSFMFEPEDYHNDLFAFLKEEHAQAFCSFIESMFIVYVM